MLRTLHPAESELVRLCREKTWTAVTQRSDSHPREATPTETTLRGEGTTALSIAIRSNAPVDVVEALIQANVHQVGITHRNRGTILHEALKHRAPDDVLKCVMEAVIHYQETNVTESLHSKRRFSPVSVFDHSQFLHVSVQTNRIVHCPPLLGLQDDLGRTALHYMVERAKRVAESQEESSCSWFLFQILLRSFPEAVQVMDSDGNTPLVLLLLTVREARAHRLEAEIYRMIQLMVAICPSAATISRKMPRPWRFLPMVDGYSSHVGDGASSPLYYALLNRRPVETVNLLLRANREVHVRGCSAIVSQHHEVCHHIAVTTRAALPVLYNVVNDFPEGVTVQDVYGLSSVDWLWIRHVLDWTSGPLDAVPSRMIARRRFLGHQFLEWHDYVSKRVPMDDDHHLAVDPMVVKQLQNDLYQRMKLLVPVAASVMAADPPYKQGEPWSLVHATCFVRCPAAMIRVAIKNEPNSFYHLRSKDLRASRYPLHYACTRMGYEANLPIGVSRTVHVLREHSPVFELLVQFPLARRATDNEDQLPLHIAIDAAKSYRLEPTRAMLDKTDGSDLEVIHCLVSSFPGSLERRDGKTKLFPWQQAAVGDGADLNSVYSLLRHQPMLVGTVKTRSQTLFSY